MGALFAAAVTVIVNACNAAVACPSLTVMTMPPYVPACALPGVPARAPEPGSNVAQAGLLVIEKASGSESTSDDEGENE